MADSDSSPTGYLLRLTYDVEAAAVARAFVEHHSDALPLDLVEDAKLLVTELVTNAVLHGRPQVTLHVSLQPPLMGVSVHDEGAAIPSTHPHPPDPTAAHGRGLLIVDRMSTSWGVIPTDRPPGKTVWFRLDSTASEQQPDPDPDQPRVR